jgi:transposase InsO family protein
MDLKMQLIGDWLKGGHTVTELSRGYDVSRKTVYKWIARYEDEGAGGLADRSRAPRSCPHAISDAVAECIIATKRRHLSFGPKKVMDRLRAEQPEVSWPADSTAGELLKRAGLVKKRRYKRPYPADPQPFHLGEANNALWSADYKGQYRSSNHRWCYPLTITDNASRYLIGCSGVSATDYAQARPVFEWAFLEYGMPEAILSDNGPPFASRAAGGLTRLSMWWVLQGIRVHRIQPGRPTQNARHERMHDTLNRAVGEQMRGASATRQQKTLNEFRSEYNALRSHESLARRPPASLYSPSQRPYRPCPRPVHYAVDQQVRTVRHNGEIKFKGELIYLSQLLAQQPVGLRQVDDDRYEVRFSFHLLGHLNMATHRLENATYWHLSKPYNV